jgi:uncharacterized protein
MKRVFFIFTIIGLMCVNLIVFAQSGPKVIAFYTAQNDQAHISFVHEASKWFSELSKKEGFTYTATNDWDLLNTNNLSNYDLVLFLDTRPDSVPQREAFEKYMENGGAWIGFHFCAFALTPSTYPQNWDWYHEYFLGSGQYVSNTWRPTSAVLKVEDKTHPAMKGLPEKFTASPNEWYRWEHDLRENPDIKILVSIDPSSFPLGNGPKPHEIWHEGYYPVVWTNVKYHMIYINMGHNEIDYEGGTNVQLSKTFGNYYQDQLIINSLRWFLKKGGI